MSKLGSLLVREGLLTESDRRMIRRESGNYRGSFAKSVLALGLLDEDELSALFAAKTAFKIARKDLSSEIEGSAVGAVPSSILQWFDVIPIKKKSGALHVAMVDPTDREVILQLEFFSGMPIRPVIASISAIRAAIANHVVGPLEFKPSEFEDFLGNHSAPASHFAQGQKGAFGVVDMSSEPVSWGSSDDDMNASNPSADGSESFELLTDEPEPSESAPAALVSDAPDDFSDAGLAASTDIDDELVDHATAEASLVADVFPESSSTELDTTTDLEALDETEASLGDNLDLNMDLGSVDGDSDFDAPASERVAGENSTAAETDSTDVLLDETPPPESAQPDDSLELDGVGTGLDLLEEGGEPAAETAVVSAPDSGLDMSLDGAALGDEILQAETALPEDISSPAEHLDDLGEMMELQEASSLEAAPAIDPLETDSNMDVPSEAIEPILETPAEELPALSDDLTAAAPSESEADNLTLELSDIDMPIDGEFAAALTEGVSDAEISFDDIEVSPPNEPSLDNIDLDGASQDAPTLGLEQEIEAPTKAEAAAPQVSFQAHEGIATLNRALVNLSLLIDGKKALGRLAEAADKVGIPSGALVKLKGDTLTPGILWNREGAHLGSIHDTPAGLSGDVLAQIVDGLSSSEKWCKVEDILGDDLGRLNAAWPAAGNQPTHIFARKLGDSFTIALARFAGAADHEGLRDSFSELVKAVGPKIAS